MSGQLPAGTSADRPENRAGAEAAGASAVGAGSLTFVTSLAIQGLNVVTGVLTAHLLGPTGKGELTAAMLWPGLLAGVLSLGVFEAAVYYSALLVGREREMFATLTYSMLALSLVAGAIGWFVIPLALGHAGPVVVALGRLYLAWLPVNFITLSAMAILRGRKRFRSYNLVRLTVIVVTCLGLSGLALADRAGFTPAGVVGIYLLAYVVTLAVVVELIRRCGWLGWRPDWTLIRPLLSYGLRSHVGSVSSQATQQGNQLLISAFLAPYDLGIFTVASSLTAGVTLLGSSVAIVVLPVVAGIVEMDRKLATLGRAVRLSLFGSSIIGGALVVAAPYIIQVFFGPAFLPAVGISRVLLGAAVILSVGQVLGTGLRACGYPLGAGSAETVAALSTLGGLAVLLPWLGLFGAALSSLLAYSASIVVLFWLLRTRLGTSFGTLLMPTTDDLSWSIRNLRRLAAPVLAR